jgi:hypothetical protein
MISVEISFDLAGVAIQHGLKIEELYIQHMSNIYILVPEGSKCSRFRGGRQRTLRQRSPSIGVGWRFSIEALSESSGVAIQH